MWQSLLRPISRSQYLAAAGLWVLLWPQSGQGQEAEKASVPWGVSASASSARNHQEWFPKIAAAGAASVRLFPEWRSVQPAPGTWKWEQTDLLLQHAAEHHLEISGILMGAAPGRPGGSHAFPMEDLPGWSEYVEGAVGRYPQVRYWEVWNEGNAAFNDAHHNTSDYARLAAATYESVKKANPAAQVGLSVASFDAPYLRQAILAQARMERRNHFDFLCIHPYELADGIGEPDGEIPYLWMTRILRDMLRVEAPERAQAEIWVSEVGRKIGKQHGRVVNDEEAAKALLKIYVMGVAQGIQRTLWFEAQDPAGEEAGFGLLNREGSARAGYAAFQALTSHLGPTPKYEGWLALGTGARGFGFVFQEAKGAVLAAWMPPGATDESIRFTGAVEVTDPIGGKTSPLVAGEPLRLADSVRLIESVPSDVLAEARAHREQSFPWGGDYSKAAAVSLALGIEEGSRGLYQLSPHATPRVDFPDGTQGVRMQSDQGAQFFAHPSFADLSANDFYVRVTVRRIGPGNVGMNLHYEVTDSQGRAAYKNMGEWYSVTPDPGWQTHTWHITGACLAKMWGYDLSVRPEQSVPFVLGKVEVSRVPYQSEP